MSPPTAPITRIGAYALVMIALGKLKSSPNTRPIIQPGQGNCTSAITKPMPKRLRNAPSNAAVLSGNDIGNIIPTEIRPKIRPLTRPDRRGAVSYTHLRAHETPEHLVCR